MSNLYVLLDSILTDNKFSYCNVELVSIGVDVLWTRISPAYNMSTIKSSYHPRVREGNVFVLSVCLSVCSVQGSAIDHLDIDTSCLVLDALTISRPCLSTKVIVSRSSHFGKMVFVWTVGHQILML